jgi:hypothetical protein
MFADTSHDNSRPAKMKAGGLSANYILNEQNGGGRGPLENKVVPIGLVLDLKRAKREVEFDDDDDADDENYKIDVLPDFIFDDFISAVSKYSVSKSRRRTERNKKSSKST